MSYHRTSQNVDPAHTRKCSTSQHFYLSCSSCSCSSLDHQVQMPPPRNYGVVCLFNYLQICSQQTGASFYHRQIQSHHLFRRWSLRQRIRFSSVSWRGRRPQYPDPSSWFYSNTYASGAYQDFDVCRYGSQRGRSRLDLTHSTRWMRLVPADRPIKMPFVLRSTPELP